MQLVQCKMALLILQTLTIAIVCIGVSAIEDYCSVNQFEKRGNYMQFTKEPSTAEFAVIGKFKGLHCCAKGYKSIEWYKDGIPYPWHGTVSELIIYPEGANQTVYTQTVKSVDAGNYTCLLRNDSVLQAHTIQLTVFDKVPDDPKITYVSDNVEASINDPVRLFCEAFVGRVDLPDAFNEVFWRKEGENASLQEDAYVRQVKVSRESGQVFGTYLIIDKVTRKDYGEYVCTISKPGKTVELATFVNETITVNYVNANPLPIKKILIFSAIVLLVILTIIVLNIQYGLLLRVQMKDRFGKMEESNKVHDILIVYSKKDCELVLGVLLPTLVNKHDYKCVSKELPENISLWRSDLAEAARQSRRIVAVISPSCIGDKWECSSLHQALQQLQDLDPRLCCVLLKEAPESKNQIKNAQGETLASFLQSNHVVNWTRAKDEKFWLSLRLGLPPKRQSQNRPASTTSTENATRLNSSESLDVFV